MSDDEELARRLVELVPTVPTAVWGRDELRTGEMWNSNSVVSWLLESAGLPTRSLAPPKRGRAPGWNAGLVAACRMKSHSDRSPVEPNAIARGCGKPAAVSARSADGELGDGA